MFGRDPEYHLVKHVCSMLLGEKHIQKSYCLVKSWLFLFIYNSDFLNTPYLGLSRACLNTTVCIFFYLAIKVRGLTLK